MISAGVKLLGIAEPELFQSLIGILGDFSNGAAAGTIPAELFQSLIGILGDFSSGRLKGLCYLVFEVHLRESHKS